MESGRCRRFAGFFGCTLHLSKYNDKIFLIYWGLASEEILWKILIPDAGEELLKTYDGYVFRTRDL